MRLCIFPVGLCGVWTMDVGKTVEPSIIFHGLTKNPVGNVAEEIGGECAFLLKGGANLK